MKLKNPQMLPSFSHAAYNTQLASSCVRWIKYRTLSQNEADTVVLENVTLPAGQRQLMSNSLLRVVVDGTLYPPFSVAIQFLLKFQSPWHPFKTMKTLIERTSFPIKVWFLKPVLNTQSTFSNNRRKYFVFVTFFAMWRLKRNHAMRYAYFSNLYII